MTYDPGLGRRACLLASRRPARFSNPLTTKVQITMKRLLIAVVLAGPLVIDGGALSAQELSTRADRKITGQLYLPHSASAYQRSALEHARTLNYYGRKYKSVPKELARQHTSEIKRNVDAAKKELAKLKAEAAKDKNLQKSLSAMEASLARCGELCRMLDTETSKPDGSNSEAICDCCDEIESELTAAEAENDKIKERLGVPAKPKK